MGLNHSPSIVTSDVGFYIDFANPKSINGLTLSDLSPNKMSISLVNPGANTISIVNGYALFNPPDRTTDLTASYYRIANSYFSAINGEMTLETCVNVVDTLGGNALTSRPVSLRIVEGSSPLGFGVGGGSIVMETATTPGGWLTPSTSGIIFNNNQWVYITQTVSRINNSFLTYVNGVLVYAISLAGNIPLNGTGILIGRGFYGGLSNFSGKVSFVRVYNRALLASEVQQNFNALRGRYNI